MDMIERQVQQEGLPRRGTLPDEATCRLCVALRQCVQPRWLLHLHGAIPATFTRPDSKLLPSAQAVHPPFPTPLPSGPGCIHAVFCGGVIPRTLSRLTPLESIPVLDDGQVLEQR